MRNFLILFTLIGMSCVSSYAYDNYEYTYREEVGSADRVITVSNGYQNGLAYINVQSSTEQAAVAVAAVFLHENGNLGSNVDGYSEVSTLGVLKEGTKVLVPQDPYDVTHITLMARIYVDDGFAFSGIYWNDEF